MKKSIWIRALLASTAGFAWNTDAYAVAGAQPPAASETHHGVEEIVVTAQKRSESINKVGMSITAISGKMLAQRGISSPEDLARIVPSFQFAMTTFDTPVYTLRGIGFYESSLAASPAVSVYVDQVPLSYPVMTTNAGLDLERLEVLKGPQGTLFGQNATGGAINYIAAKPTDHLKAGFDLSYGRFNTTEVSGFISGPVAPTLSMRLAVKGDIGDGWQKSYTRDATLGAPRKAQARLLTDWKPDDRLKVEVNLNGNFDKSDTQAAQLILVQPGNPAEAYPALLNYPLAPHNPQAADWDNRNDLRRDNKFWQAAVRADYTVNNWLQLVSITSYAHQQVKSLVDADGTDIQSVLWDYTGHISSFDQELRAVANLDRRTRLVVGGNYAADSIYDSNLIYVTGSTTRETLGLPTPDAVNFTQQNVHTGAVFGSLDYKLTDALTAQGGIRYTDVHTGFDGCSRDAGDGTLAAVYNELMGLLRGAGNFTPVQPGGCGTLNDATLQSGLVTGHLYESNISWRTGLNWQVRPSTLLYVNISKGYKSGSFPTLSATVASQYSPAHQESVLAYEGGFKTSFADHRVQLNGAAFYYDYSNKQIRGNSPDLLFGILEKLVNVPKSEIIGAEGQVTFVPVDGLTLTGAVTYLYSDITKDFINYDANAVLTNFKGSALPRTPKFSSVADIEYEFPISNRLSMFAGASLTYQSSTNSKLGDLSIYALNSYAILDARLGVEDPAGKWKLWLYGKNLTNAYYWDNVYRQYDDVVRYAEKPVTYGVQLSYRFQ